MIAAALWVLALAGLATLAYWSAVLYHVVKTLVVIPAARRGLNLPLAGPGERPPRVWVIVPAHDEEGCIAEIAASLAGQEFPGDEPLTCLFVLDRCTDRTREVLERAWAAAPGARETNGAGGGKPRMEVLELRECPPGWVGKSHALWSGVGYADASGRPPEVLLFVDADTWLHPGLVRSSVALMRERGVGMLSLLSTLAHRHWFEHLVQPAAGMELMRQYPVARANLAEGRRAFANGQFILMTREAYRTIGGHEALKDAVLEDVELARRCAWMKIPAALLLGGGMLQCRMYETYGSFKTGWKRIFGESSNRKPARVRKMARRVRLVGTVLPVLSLAAVVAGLVLVRAGEGAGAGGAGGAAGWSLWLGAAGLAVHLLVVLVVYGLGQTPLWAAPGFAVGSWMVGGIMHEAADDLERGRPTVWGGREYAREAR